MMLADPLARGRALAGFYHRVEPSLWNDLLESGALEGVDEARARREWECVALHACIRGLVAAGGFGDKNMDAMDALHDAVAAAWEAEPGPPEPLADRRERVALRYDEYAHLGRESEGATAPTLGAAAARRVSGTDIARAELIEMLGELHEAIAQGAAEFVRRGEP
jgi:hypothetical protein